MGRIEKIRKTSRKIVKLLKQVPEHISIKCGTEFEFIPKPVWKLFFEIHVLNSLAKEEQEKQNANREKSDKRLHRDDESVGERDST